MKVVAALLLVAFASGVVSLTTSSSLDASEKSTGASVTTKAEDATNATTTAAPKSLKVQSKYSHDTTPESTLDDSLLAEHASPFLNPKDLLLQEIDALDEEASSTKMQDEVARTFKAEAEKFRPSTTGKPTAAKNTGDVSTTPEYTDIKKQLELVKDNTSYEGDDTSEDEEDENDGAYNDQYADEEKEDELAEDELDDEEQVLTECPDYCRCAGAYAAATTATCTKLVEEQSFGTGIAHLRIANAGQIRLGPHALRSRGLQHLESITITDTRIVELHPSAFDGIPYLFSVNLTRNSLQDIHPSIFQNNTQLSLLAISGNPLKYTQDSKLAKHGLFDARSISEFDFSYNGLTKLKRTAFAKIPGLTHVNLRGNRLKEIESITFNPLGALVELDLSDNMLSVIPIDLFYNKGVRVLHVVGNNLTTLSTIRASTLRTLDASHNKIKIIAKEDLLGVPLLNTLTISSNGLKRIHQHAFAPLIDLTVLDISGNKLTSLTEHHFRTNSRLEVLIISDNPGLETLPVFKGADTEYDAFSIYRFDCSNCGLDYLDKDTFIGMPALSQLDLSRNRLTGLPNGLLSSLSSLGVLDLSDNIISSLESNMFQGLKSLTELSLASNPLVTLQVTPFLATPALTRLDVSRCALERVWSEARVSLTSLRSLSVRENQLRRITVEELKATPNLGGLDLADNPLDCDDEFSQAVQWLTDHGVKPSKHSRHISNYDAGDSYQDSVGISKWTDLAKVICDGISDGPPDRSIPHKVKTLPSERFDIPQDTLLRNDFVGEEDLFKQHMDHGMKLAEELEKAWTSQDQEYEDFVLSENMEYHPWYTSALWPVVTVVIIAVMVLLLTAHIAMYLARRRGRGPVLRPPMILRQGLIDNKNCGLVYKPLQEEIATPHVPKRGSFYSSSTFHYDKIVPESV